MPSYGAEALVLKKVNFGEADQVVTLLTKHRGKISVVAKGVRKIGSRKGGNLDHLNYIKAYLAEGKNLDIVTEVELISAWPDLKSDLTKISNSYQIVELINELLADHQENQSVFNLMIESLELLEKSDKSEQLVQAFEVKLLNLLGFRPELERCVRCGGALRTQGLAISAELGGLIGPEEREFDVTAYPISPEAVKAWRFFQQTSLGNSLKLNLPEVVAGSLGRALQYYLEYLLERELKSPELTRQIKNING